MCFCFAIRTIRAEMQMPPNMQVPQNMQMPQNMQVPPNMQMSQNMQMPTNMQMQPNVQMQPNIQMQMPPNCDFRLFQQIQSPPQHMYISPEIAWLMNSSRFIPSQPNATFPQKLYNLLMSGANGIMDWTPRGTSFKVSDHDRLAQEILPLFFKRKFCDS